MRKPLQETSTDALAPPSFLGTGGDPRARSAAELPIVEAELIDKRKWDEWLDLFMEDVEYWIPAWDSENELTTDPRSELSLIYHDSRKGLEDRVFRLRSGKSLASTPPPRTCHNIFNIRARLVESGNCHVDAGWQVLSYRFGETAMSFGFYEYLLVPHEQGWRIQKKKIIVLNDTIHHVLDINLV